MVKRNSEMSTHLSCNAIPSTRPDPRPTGTLTQIPANEMPANLGNSRSCDPCACFPFLTRRAENYCLDLSLKSPNANMPAVTRSRKQPKKSADFYILIDKTPRNVINKSTSTTAKVKPKPKKKALEVTHPPPAEAKSKAKTKRPTKLKPSSRKAGVEAKDTAQYTDIGEPDDLLQHALSTARPPAIFATPPRSHLPPPPPRLPDPRSYDPTTTLPPQFNYDGTPSPEPGRRRSHRASARASSLLPPSSPIHLPFSPPHQIHSDLSDPKTIFLSAHRPGSPSQFRTPTRKDKKRKRTPLSKPHLQSEGEVNNDDLFAYGVVDDLDSREDSVDGENAGSDKENHGDPAQLPGSEFSDNELVPSMRLTVERGILQPRGGSLSPAHSSNSDPFGFFAVERLLKARRAETLGNSEAGPSGRHHGPRRPLGELAAAEVAPATRSVQATPSPSTSHLQPAPAPPNPRYSDSEIEDLYAPASPPHTPRQRLPHTDTSPHHDSTPVDATAPLTPRNGDSARAFTMRRRRQKELHAVSEHGSEFAGSSAPSSPSPAKRVHHRPPDPESQLDYDNQESDEEDRRPQKRPKFRGKGKGKENARGKGSTTEDPIGAARRVLEDAPRRKTERRTTATRKSKSTSGPAGVSGSLHEGQTRPSRGRRATRNAGGQASRSKKGSVGSRTRKKKKDESTPEDLREVRLSCHYSLMREAD